MTAEARLAAAYAGCFEAVRRDSHDLWLASLFWPEAARPHAHALLAFQAEVARIPSIVSEPMLGEIRLQWWRDAIGNDEPAGNPTAEALLDTVRRFNLDREALIGLLEARAFDLYDDPMPTEAALETYLRHVWASPLVAIARVLSPGRLPSPAVESAALAYGLTILLRDLPFQVMRGRMLLPLDLLAAHGASAETVLAHRFTPELGRALAALRGRVRMHLGEMRASLAGRAVGNSACLPCALCGPILRRMESRAYDPFAAPVEVSGWRQQVALWRMARYL